MQCIIIQAQHSDNIEIQIQDSQNI